MKLDLSHNCEDLIARLREKAHSFPTVARKAVIEATRVMYQGARELLSELIYNQAIPTIRRFRRLKAEDGSWRSAGESKGKQRRFFGFSHSSRQSNKQAWRRTSTLLRNERFYFRGKGPDTEGVIDNKTPYAKARHDLNKPSPIDGKTRRAPWRAEAMDRYSDNVYEMFRYWLRLAD